MTLNEAVEYINDPKWNTVNFGLDRTRELLKRLGSPHERLKFMHVAGSNGKGSVCAMLEAILRCSGYRTGFYLSPAVNDFNETFQISGQSIDDESLCEITAKVREAADSMADHPTQFEIKTAVGMFFFEQSGCDIVILETGMGGEFDSTNVIPAPEIAVITNIGLEHTAFLGDTLGKIAKTKAGIIKTGCDVICYDNTEEVRSVIEEVCKDRGCGLYFAGEGDVRLLERSVLGQTVVWTREDLRIMLPLLGDHQRRNASVVLAAAETMRKKGWRITDESIIKGMASVKWPARFEVLREGPLFILDGGHNPQCAAALSETIRSWFPSKQFIFLMGVLADKDYVKMVDEVLPFAAEFVCITPDSERALPAEELSRVIKEKGMKAGAVNSPSEAVEYALSSGKDIIAFGSLYMAGIIRKLIKNK